VLNRRLQAAQRKEDRKNQTYQHSIHRRQEYFANHVGQRSKAVTVMRERLRREEDEYYVSYRRARQETERIQDEVNRRTGFVQVNHPSDEEGANNLPGHRQNVPVVPPAVPIPEGFAPVDLPAPDMEKCGKEDHLTGEDYDPERTVMLSDGRCYSYAFVVQLYNDAVRRRRPFISPFTRQPFSPPDVNIVLTIKQRLQMGGAQTRKLYKKYV
jgi:hypothetical protein